MFRFLLLLFLLHLSGCVRIVDLKWIPFHSFRVEIINFRQHYRFLRLSCRQRQGFGYPNLLLAIHAYVFFANVLR